MILFATALQVFIGAQGLAAGKADDRTIVKAVRKTDGNPRSADGFEINLQIRKQVMADPAGPSNTFGKPFALWASTKTAASWKFAKSRFGLFKAKIKIQSFRRQIKKASVTGVAEAFLIFAGQKRVKLIKEPDGRATASKG